MAEVGIDISAEQPKPLSTDAVEASDVVITMGCGDACPIYPGKRNLHWRLPDPAGQGVNAVRPSATRSTPGSVTSSPHPPLTPPHRQPTMTPSVLSSRSDMSCIIRCAGNAAAVLRGRPAVAGAPEARSWRTAPTSARARLPGRTCP
jgi:hypothetical protein